MGKRLLSALSGRPAEDAILVGQVRTWRRADILGEVDMLADRLAGGRVLAVLADNGPEWLMADLAALAAGVVHLPLPTFFHPAQLAHAVVSAGADLALSDRPERLESLGFRTVGRWHGLSLMRRAAAGVALPAGTRKITFTSGSTGAPQGVCLGDGLLDTAEALLAALSHLPLARHLAVLPLALLLENVAGGYAPLLRGMSVHLPALARLGWRGMAGFDARALAARVAGCGADSLILVPELLKAWLEATAPVPAGLAFVAVGGARCDVRLIEDARARGLPVHQGYGLTECGSVVCLNVPGADRPASVGRPLPHVRLTVDAEGEVWVNAPAFLGYLGGTGAPDGAFATGDLGRLDEEGFLHLAGRRGNVLITGLGRNVSPEWVEAALLAHPAISQAMVVGEGRPWLAALLVPAAGASPEAVAAAVSAANARLPDYARVVRWQLCPPFTAENGLATGNGRILRVAIVRRWRRAIESLYANEENLP